MTYKIFFVIGLVFLLTGQLLLAQGNVGGSTTAIALAESFNRKELILPAILVGTLGNALGTYLGFLIIYIL